MENVRTNDGMTGAPQAAPLGQNPLAAFEECAHRIWASGRSNEDRADRFARLAEAIGRYINRVNADVAARKLDTWSTLSISRSKQYLTQLAVDVKQMAAVCRDAAIHN